MQAYRRRLGVEPKPKVPLFAYFSRSLQICLTAFAILGCQTMHSVNPAAPSAIVAEKPGGIDWQPPAWLEQNTSPGLNNFVEYRGRFSLDLASSKSELQVENSCGDIFVKNSNREGWLGASVVAQQAPKTTMPSVFFRMEGVRWFIEVRCSDRSDSARSRLDLNIFVPRLLLLALQTNDGNIRALGLQGTTRINSQSGRLMLASRAAIDVRSDLGNVFLQSFDSHAPTRIFSRRGDIELTLPDQEQTISAIGKSVDNHLLKTSLVAKVDASVISVEAKNGRVTLLPSLILE